MVEIGFYHFLPFLPGTNRFLPQIIEPCLIMQQVLIVILLLLKLCTYNSEYFLLCTPRPFTTPDPLRAQIRSDLKRQKIVRLYPTRLLALGSVPLVCNNPYNITYFHELRVLMNVVSIHLYC